MGDQPTRYQTFYEASVIETVISTRTEMEKCTHKTHLPYYTELLDTGHRQPCWNNLLSTWSQRKIIILIRDTCSVKERNVWE